jgi:hypothetical protein
VFHPHRAIAVKLDSGQRSAILNRIITMKQEHRDLDRAIATLSAGPYADELQLRRMKKRRLQIKDMIVRLESLLLPDKPA